MRAPNPLNPEAGHVQMPEDPAEVDAALRAGRITQRLVPYYGWRYGERGRAFTRSDSGWLAWLARHDQAVVDKQIAWLWSVLANRGMPGRLLELHLGVLRRQLARANPDRAADYDRLVAAAGTLATRRTTVLSETAAARVGDDLAAELGHPGHGLLVGTGRLIADAVADHRCGAGNAVSSLTSWLGDVEALRAAPGLAAALPDPLADELRAPGAARRWTAVVRLAVSSAEHAATR